MTFEKEHIVLTIGGVIATGAIAYLIFRMQERDAAANTQAQIDAAEQSASEQASAIASLPSIQVPAISASTTNTSSGDIATASANGGSPAPDPALEALISGFLTSPLNSVVLQSTPVAQIGALPAPSGPIIPAVTIPSLNTGNPGEAIISGLSPYRGSSLAV